MSPKDLEAIADSLEAYANRLRELAEVAQATNQAIEDVVVPAISMSHDPGTTLDDDMKSFHALLGARASCKDKHLEIC